MSGDTARKSHSAQKKVMSLFEFNWCSCLQERFEFFCRECNVLGETCGSLTHSCIHLFPPSFQEHSQQNSYSATPAFKKIDLLQKSIGGHVLDLGIDCFLCKDEELNLESTYSVLTIPFPLKRLILFEICFPTFLFVVFFVFSCINTSPLLACMTLSKWTEASSQQINSLIDSVVVRSWLAFHFHEEWHTPR